MSRVHVIHNHDFTLYCVIFQCMRGITHVFHHNYCYISMSVFSVSLKVVVFIGVNISLSGADLGSILRGVQHEKGTSTNGYLTRKGT